uniref:PYL3 n=1 Tax=Epimedium pseudowushanense TaxID=589473 RepID=A0A7R6BKM0_9MAGN|nr:PYL3 [Epimedium pseudowushanense]
MPSSALPRTSLHLQKLTISSKQPIHHIPQPSSVPVPDTVACYHKHDISPSQCSSVLTQIISAPVSTVWSILRLFETPQAYKQFVKTCKTVHGHGNVGSLREVHLVSGLPAATSTERLEILDDERHLLSFSIIGGDHRLANYRSVTTLHASSNGTGTIVVESYVVDVPVGNTKEETCVFVDTIVRCNLQSLAKVSQQLTTQRK